MSFRSGVATLRTAIHSLLAGKSAGIPATGIPASGAPALYTCVWGWHLRNREVKNFLNYVIDRSNYMQVSSFCQGFFQNVSLKLCCKHYRYEMHVSLCHRLTCCRTPTHVAVRRLRTAILHFTFFYFTLVHTIS